MKHGTTSGIIWPIPILFRYRIAGSAITVKSIGSSPEGRCFCSLHRDFGSHPSGLNWTYR
jgi:hypothetical protein